MVTSENVAEVDPRPEDFAKVVEARPNKDRRAVASLMIVFER